MATKYCLFIIVLRLGKTKITKEELHGGKTTNENLGC